MYGEGEQAGTSLGGVVPQRILRWGALGDWN